MRFYAIVILNMSRQITIRHERESEYRLIEEMTRDAFYNVYAPGCVEHYILHRFRSLPSFIKELDYVLLDGDELVAHIMYAKGEIKLSDGNRKPVICFGPVSARVDKQKQGYGSALINFTLKKAMQLGYGAVLICGNPSYYHRFGFVSASNFDIKYCGLDDESLDTSFFMAKELKAGYLKGISGAYKDPEGYEINERDVDEFDATFPKKEKKRSSTQIR